MTYAESLDFLAGLGRFGMRPGLATTQRLAELAGNPQDRLRFLHVAGTNGKGSTCAFLESIARHAGWRVGLYTSPHLVSFRERLQVDRTPVTEDDVARLVGEVRGFCARLPAEATPTFFEFATLMALRWFEEQRCDLVVWETGLGGRLDATNIVRPLVTVITPIGWDHQEWLGSTLAAIAGEKAGILKPGVPAVAADSGAEPTGVLERVAREQQAPLRILRPADPEFALVDGIRLPLRGGFQRTNAALAAAAAGLLPAPFRPTRRALEDGLTAASWPGRFQVIPRGDGTLVLDGAHNPPGFHALAETLRREFPGRRYALVLGMLADKDSRSAAEQLVPGASRTVVVPVSSSRGTDPAGLRRACETVAGEGGVGQAAGLEAAMALLSAEDLVVVTGSLYLVGEALEWLARGDQGRGGGGPEGFSAVSERALNDWGRTR